MKLMIKLFKFLTLSFYRTSITTYTKYLGNLLRIVSTKE